jgi:hypothetical protein
MDADLFRGFERRNDPATYGPVAAGEVARGMAQ